MIRWTLVPSHRSFPWVVAAGVVLLSAILAWRVSTVYLIALIAGTALLVLLRWPQLGLLGIVSGLVVPFSISTGSQTPLNVTFILIPVLLGLWGADRLLRRNFALTFPPTTFPLLALLVSATISLMTGGLNWNVFASTAPLPTQLVGWAIFAFSIGAYFLVSNLVDNPRWLQAITICFLSVGGLYMAGRFGIPGPSALSATMGRLASDGSLLWVWIVALALGQSLFNTKLDRVFRLALLMLVAATVYIGFFRARDWASGWLPPLVAIGVIVWLRSRPWALIFAIIGISVLFIAAPGFVAGLAGADTYSIETRNDARDILLGQVFPLSPLFGLGPANYYFYTPLYSILGYYVRFNSHNNYIDILLQIGIIGLFCFAWVFAEIGLLGWRLRGRFAGDFACGYVNGCLGGLAGTLVSAWLGDWMLPFVYNIGLNGFRASVLAWMFLGGLAALNRLSGDHAIAFEHRGAEISGANPS